MDHNQIVKSLMFIKPNAEFILDNDGLNWLDEVQSKPTEKQIKDGWLAYEAAEKSKAEAKANAKSALLDRLGLTEDEAKLLLG